MRTPRRAAAPAVVAVALREVTTAAETRAGGRPRAAAPGSQLLSRRAAGLSSPPSAG
jgi:hypothetical protein